MPVREEEMVRRKDEERELLSEKVATTEVDILREMEGVNLSLEVRVRDTSGVVEKESLKVWVFGKVRDLVEKRVLEGVAVGEDVSEVDPVGGVRVYDERDWVLGIDKEVVEDTVYEKLSDKLGENVRVEEREGSWVIVGMGDIVREGEIEMVQDREGLLEREVLREKVELNDHEKVGVIVRDTLREGSAE